MKEIKVILQFITPCLAGIRRKPCDSFERSADGSVVFLDQYWRETLNYGSRAYNRCQNLVRHVKIHPCITGATKVYRRYYGEGQYTDHEAFLVGDMITINAMIPDGMTEADLREILRFAGGYKGISPWGWQSGFGRFIVK